MADEGNPELTTIAVIGAGQMGGGIAEVAAKAGLSVLLHDAEQRACDKALERIRLNLERDVTRGRLEASEAHRVYQRINVAASLDDLVKTDFMIEAVVEDEKVKIELFQKLNRLCPPTTIFASNTSSISITRMGARSGRPDRFIGMHFMNPVPVMRLVEIVRGLGTSEQTYSVTKALAHRMGKITMVAQDYPGFVVNRILLPMINEAAFALYEGVASAEDIDTAMRLGANHPMGPLELADLIGLDTCLAVMEVLYDGLGDDKYRPCPLLRKYVDAGYLGRKVGRGFYSYDPQGNRITPKF